MFPDGDYHWNTKNTYNLKTVEIIYKCVGNNFSNTYLNRIRKLKENFNMILEAIMSKMELSVVSLATCLYRYRLRKDTQTAGPGMRPPATFSFSVNKSSSGATAKVSFTGNWIFKCNRTVIGSQNTGMLKEQY